MLQLELMNLFGRISVKFRELAYIQKLVQFRGEKLGMKRGAARAYHTGGEKSVHTYPVCIS